MVAAGAGLVHLAHFLSMMEINSIRETIVVAEVITLLGEKRSQISGMVNRVF